MDTAVILASRSPRRQDLLRQIGVEFSVQPAEVDESIRLGEEPESYALRIAVDKVTVVARKYEKGIVIAADTVVVDGANILGKPVDAHDAVRMLDRLSGKKHLVITGLAVIDVAEERLLTGVAKTNVWFRTMTRHEINNYVATGEPLDKAGAYGIQGRGALFVERIEGCYSNVVGLPISLLGRIMKDLSHKIV